MLLELAIMGLVGYAAIKNPDKAKEVMDKTVDRMGQKMERQHRNGEISDEQYVDGLSKQADYWIKRSEQEK